MYFTKYKFCNLLYSKKDKSGFEYQKFIFVSSRLLVVLWLSSDCHRTPPLALNVEEA